MLIGQDFPKIKLDFYGLELLEPNAFVGDMILCVLCAVFAKKTFNSYNHPFFKHWGWFFTAFSAATLFGGFGHLLYEYTGTLGKLPSWYLGFFATFFVEQAMISLYPDNRVKTVFKSLSSIKLVMVVLSTTIVYSFFDLQTDLRIGMHINTANTSVGLSFSLFYLSIPYLRIYGRAFNYFLISYFILLPAAFVQGLKINIHPWFDRNDVGHCLLVISIILYYIGVKHFKKMMLSRDK